MDQVRRETRTRARIGGVALAWLLSGAICSVPGQMAAEASPQGRSTVARLLAELIKRDDGSWVIVSLKQGSLDPKDEAEVRKTEGRLSARDQRIRDTLDTYASAIENRDMQALSSVWQISPNERATLDRLFKDSRMIALQINNPRALVRTNHAVVDFEQRLAIATNSGDDAVWGRFAKRSLAARDAFWGWDPGTSPAEAD